MKAALGLSSLGWLFKTHPSAKATPPRSYNLSAEATPSQALSSLKILVLLPKSCDLEQVTLYLCAPASVSSDEAEGHLDN